MDELAALECARVTLDWHERRYHILWSDDERFVDWRKIPGGECSMYTVNAADLRYERDEIEADDWHHLCSIIGLKEAIARVFFRATVEESDFEQKHLAAMTLEYLELRTSNNARLWDRAVAIDELAEPPVTGASDD